MKLSVSLPDDDVGFLDDYVERHGLGSRSAAVQAAVSSLRREGLTSAYEIAFAEHADELAGWDVTVGDGLD
ncbi:MAG: ribbon-helix-helix domain-containing protein [Actinomycetota bacterium]